MLTPAIAVFDPSGALWATAEVYLLRNFASGVNLISLISEKTLRLI